MLRVYGIPNCDQIKKTCKWLNDHGIEFEFYDYKKQDITKKKITEWCKIVDWQQLLNKRSRTWKELGEKDKSNLTQAKAVQLMQQYPTLIKRPVVLNGSTIIVGLDSKEFAQKLK